MNLGRRAEYGKKQQRNKLQSDLSFHIIIFPIKKFAELYK